MTLAVGGASSGLFNGAANPGWLADTFTAIKNSQHSAGLIGMLDNARKGNSLKSFLDKSRSMSNGFALITQSGVANAGSYYSQLAQQNQQKRADKLLQKTMEDLERSRNAVKPKNVLDSFIYFADGTSLDTEKNILTMSDGTQYDTTTGALYVDPSSIMQLANGAYLDTKNNILTMSDGTRIDNVTGQKVSVEA
jgi:hypothetical protein